MANPIILFTIIEQILKIAQKYSLEYIADTNWYLLLFLQKKIIQYLKFALLQLFIHFT